MTVFANRGSTDLIRNAFYKQLHRGDVLCVASPFFSYDKLVLEMANRGCDVRMVVRLGPATSPQSLARATKDNRVQVRFFTSRRFHSKLYVFGDHLALVGSANMTEVGVQSNHEVCVSVSPEAGEFDELVTLFQSYWDAAEVLTPERLETYEKLYREREDASSETKLENDVAAAFGEVGPVASIRVGRRKPSKDKLFLENYRRTYQEFIAAYRAVEQVYKADGRRLQPEEAVPIRIEIDQFLSFIRERQTSGDDYLAQPLRDGVGIAATAAEHFDQWFADRWAYLDNHIPQNYATITAQLGTHEAIASASAEELFDGLDVCHSFHDRFRFYSGGHPTMRAAFLADNDPKQVKKVLTYLLHGSGDFVERMGTCIFAPDFKLAHVGRSVVQELFGWVNGEEVPVCNGRTVKALRHLGARVKIFT